MRLIASKLTTKGTCADPAISHFFSLRQKSSERTHQLGGGNDSSADWDGESSSSSTTCLPPFNASHEIEKEAERKVGWLLKLIFAGTATFLGYQIFPYMGDNLLQQSVSLLQVKDPLFKRMGASRLARFSIDDERRMKIVEIGGAQELLNMLGAAKDDRTRKEALKALHAISHSDEAVGALHKAGAILVIKSTPDSAEDMKVNEYKSNLMKRFRDLSYDVTS